ncbi:hypothetical protein BUALT_Bualt12G0101400 [Buddleja alternifolia]|uniref:Uncharacterized protein n=1 Tax=Buddleja alternifolia TaxID=168488 RepID=A0AAV6WUW3_9LAMI|nr:hypothetical protein BUALT_Bualt12G0101400 [Buddleja alternifolia]
MIHGVPGQRDYIKTSFQPLLPPKLKVKRGRPPKLRKKGPDELHRTSTRKGLTHKCKNCLSLGHNRSKCPNPTHPDSIFYMGTEAPTGLEVVSQNTDAPPSSQRDANFSNPAAPAQTNRKTKKQSIYGGKGSSKKDWEQGSNNPKPTTSKSKKSSISEVLQNIRDRASKRKGDPL